MNGRCYRCSKPSELEFTLSYLEVFCCRGHEKNITNNHSKTMNLWCRQCKLIHQLINIKEKLFGFCLVQLWLHKLSQSQKRKKEKKGSGVFFSQVHVMAFVILSSVRTLNPTGQYKYLKKWGSNFNQHTAVLRISFLDKSQFWSGCNLWSAPWKGISRLESILKLAPHSNSINTHKNMLFYATGWLRPKAHL